MMTDDQKRQAHIERTIRYNAQTMKQIKFNLRRTNPDDAEIIEYLERVDNVQGLIKNLLKESMRQAEIGR